jgi:NNP family nitrate/nitrite transporter-like MFS transporter
MHATGNHCLILFIRPQGGGISYIVIHSGLYPLFKLMCGGNAELAWRTVLIIPAAIGFTTSIVIFNTTDDSPKGNYTDLKAHGYMKSRSVLGSLLLGMKNLNTWILLCQYACSSGVEIAMEVAASTYFVEKFGLSEEAAQAIIAIFSWMNLFVSDMPNEWLPGVDVGTHTADFACCSRLVAWVDF